MEQQVHSVGTRFSYKHAHVRKHAHAHSDRWVHEKKTKQKHDLPAGKCVNPYNTHTLTRACARAHTSKRAETLFNFDEEIPVKKGLKSMNSLWGCTCRALTVKIRSNDTLRRRVPTMHIPQPRIMCLFCSKEHIAKYALPSPGAAATEKKGKQEEEKKPRILFIFFLLPKTPEGMIVFSLRHHRHRPPMSSWGHATEFSAVGETTRARVINNVHLLSSYGINAIRLQLLRAVKENTLVSILWNTCRFIWIECCEANVLRNHTQE